MNGNEGTPEAPAQELVKQQAEGSGAPEVGTAIATASGRSEPFRGLSRHFKEGDLENPLAKKTLLYALDQAEDACGHLKRFRDDFYRIDKDLAVLREKLLAKKLLDVWTSAGLSLGGLAIGLGAKYWEQAAAGILLVALGVVLIVLSIITQVVRATRA